MVSDAVKLPKTNNFTPRAIKPPPQLKVFLALKLEPISRSVVFATERVFRDGVKKIQKDLYDEDSFFNSCSVGHSKSFPSSSSPS